MNNSQNMNISKQNITGPCDLKCAYNFKYPESNCTAQNNGSFITLTYDNGSVPPVLFNNQKYSVINILIVAPSIHLFNGNQAAGEMCIQHSSYSGGQNMNVCIPLISSDSSAESSNLLSQIIQSVTSNAPNETESTNVNLTDFTLNNIVPNKPFYNYSDTENNTWIVFDILNAISINSSTLNSLTQIIQPYSISTTGTSLFFNSKGPNSSGNSVGDGIYISCQPTGSSEEETAVSYTKDQTNYNLFNNPTTLLIFQILIGCIVFIAVFFCMNYAYNFFTGSKPPIVKINS